MGPISSTGAGWGTWPILVHVRPLAENVVCPQCIRFARHIQLVRTLVRVSYIEWRLHMLCDDNTLPALLPVIYVYFSEGTFSLSIERGTNFA